MASPACRFGDLGARNGPAGGGAPRGATLGGGEGQRAELVGDGVRESLLAREL